MLHDFTALPDDVPAAAQPLAVCVALHYPSAIMANNNLRIARLHRKYHCVPTPQIDANLRPSERVRAHHVGGSHTRVARRSTLTLFDL